MMGTSNRSAHDAEDGELRRIEAVARYRDVVTATDRMLDVIARAASRALEARSSYVAFVDADRERLVSAWQDAPSDTPRDLSLSGEVVARGEPVVVSDTHADRRFATFPWVTGAPRARSCAAAPLVTRDSQRLGAVCVLDYVSSPTGDRGDLLQLLADLTVGILEARLDARRWQEVAEDARAQLDRYRLLLNSTNEGIFCIDVDGVCTYANAACARFLGYGDQTDLIGKEMHALVHHSRADKTPYPRDDCPVIRAMEAHEGVHLDGDRLWRADGTPLVCEMWATPMARGGKVIGAVCTFVDVSARKHWEDELRNVAYLSERFVSILAHDLRNPLGAIVVSAASLEAHTGRAPRRALNIIRAAAARMQRMIDSLLDVARIRTTGGIEVTPRLADMNDICRRTIEEHRAAAPARMIRLHEAGNAAGMWDTDRVEQAVGNLIANALKFSPNGSAVDVWVVESGDMVTVTVRNESEPIPGGEIPHLFEPFRASATAPGVPRCAGLGLGLFIVKEVARAHGGRVSVDSSAERGTVFTFTLPRYGTMATELHPPP